MIKTTARITPSRDSRAMSRTWNAEQLAEVFTEFETRLAGTAVSVGDGLALSFQDPERALAYLNKTFRKEIDLDEMADDARAIMSELFNRWGLLLKNGGLPEEALPIFDSALASATDETAQAIHYNRGFCALMASVADLEGGHLLAIREPRETVRLWRAAAEDLKDAVRLNPDDDAAYAQLGLAMLLLSSSGVTLTIAARREFAEQSEAAYARCLEILVPEEEHARAGLEENRRMAERVARALDEQPFWRRALGRAPEVPLA